MDLGARRVPATLYNPSPLAWTRICVYFSVGVVVKYRSFISSYGFHSAIRCRDHSNDELCDLYAPASLILVLPATDCTFSQVVILTVVGYDYGKLYVPRDV